jgi:hypothetical protein
MAFGNPVAVLPPVCPDMLSDIHRPWLADPSWFATYGATTAKLKGHHGADDADAAAAAIEAAMRRVYRGVALDIDGTLTAPLSTNIDPRMSDVVDGLLARGVPVLLITGRGRQSARAAAFELREQSALNDWHFRQLHCLANNGVWFLSTPSSAPQFFLEAEAELPGLPPLPQPLLDEVAAVLDSCSMRVIDGDTAPGAGDVQVRRASNFMRLVCAEAAERDSLHAPCSDAGERASSPDVPIYVYAGAYGSTSSLDITTTHKGRALDYWAVQMGLPPDRILRIGDQGHREGNDFPLLDSVCGFSVRNWSATVDRCHPVLHPSSWEALSGADATHELLRLALIFPSLSLAPSVPPETIDELRVVHRHATLRSRSETRLMNQRLRLQIASLFGGDDADSAVAIDDVTVNDIFDPLSGGVKVWDWELDGLASDHPAVSLLTIPRRSPRRKSPGYRWSMFTDTGILLRGPAYYYHLSVPKAKRSVSDYISVVLPFLSEAGNALRCLQSEAPTLERFKLLVAIQDNVRNIGLTCSQLLFALGASRAPESQGNRVRYAEWLAQYPHLVVAVADAHMAALIDGYGEWQAVTQTFAELADLLALRVDAAFSADVAALIDSSVSESDAFKWRECDHFVQNLSAVLIGLQGRIVTNAARMKTGRLVAVGVAYGGQELPAIAKAVGARQGIEIVPALLRASLYQKSDLSNAVRAGSASYIDRLRDAVPLCVASQDGEVLAGDQCVLMDDNCTTLTTVQLARDLLVIRGVDVLRAIIVRYPGLNREAHMAMDGHGFPDPSMLFSFVKGLVAPSPYTRLLAPETGPNPYLDEAKVFDKSRKRLEFYVEKNGETWR